MDDDYFSFHDLHIDVLAVPGHTWAILCTLLNLSRLYFAVTPCLLWAVGRVFEGTHEQMYHSLNRLAALPAETKVYCMHEYTLSNAKVCQPCRTRQYRHSRALDRVGAMRYLGQCTPS